MKILNRFINKKEDKEELGRNAPCWCGSGKKYKRCHLDNDAHKRRAKGGLGARGK